MIPGIGAGGSLGAGKQADRAANSLERAKAGMLMPQALSFREMIANDLAHAQQQVALLTRINELLDKNSDVEELLTLLQQRGRY